MNILIVDDNSTNRKLLSAVLQAEAMKTLEATDGRQAFAILEREKVDAVISDILMPHMDGYQLCQQIRRSKRFNKVPFIHYTSTYTSPADRKLSESVGADRYLAKPAPSHLLLTTLRELMSERRSRATRAHALPDDAVVMREYNAALVRKLEERNADLETARAELCQINEELERRVHERTAQLEAANKELQAFSHSVAHDLQAPLRAIGGFSQALREECASGLSAEGGQYLHRIIENVRRMRQFIDDLLSLASVGFLNLVSQSVNLSHMVDEIAVELRRSEPERAVEFQVATNLVVSGDKVLLRVLLENLLGNAWKFTGKRAKTRIEFGVMEKRGHGIQPAAANSLPSTLDSQPVFFVRDNGAGFEMAHADKLFNPFQRLHNPSEYPGSGIGLATVQRIITRHGGRVWAESKPDEGATFYFTL